MLAFELYSVNKNSTRNRPIKEFPFKKIYFKNGMISIDEKTLENYGSKTRIRTQILQNWLQMSLNTIDIKKLNLPDFRTGAASLNPYIEIYGAMTTNKSQETKISISIEKKSDNEAKACKINHVLNVTDGKITCSQKGKIILKLDKEHYFIESNTLFSQYVNSRIIDKDGILNIQIYNKIITKFLEFVKKQKLSDNVNKGRTAFRLYILPDDSTIQNDEQESHNKDKLEVCSGVDYFGNKAEYYPTLPTRTAKFLTFDDPAFTINCTTESNFYKNIGIGNSSLDKINVNYHQTFTISRLEWTFIDILKPDYEFKEISKGILLQIYENYILLSKERGLSEKTGMKIICIKKDQKKEEILIDENLTMNVLKNMFAGITDIPIVCIEIFIDDSGKSPIWATYIYVIKNVLAGNKIPKEFMLSYFNKMLRRFRYDWIKSKNMNDAKEFFTKSSFCLKYL